jgi:hypothetical protein
MLTSKLRALKPVHSAGERNNAAMPLSPQFDTEDAVLVTVGTDSSFDLIDGPLFLPAGTRLAGIWPTEQPGDRSLCAVVVGEVTWHFPLERVTLTHLSTGLAPWQEQARIAQESLTLAQEREREGLDAEAVRLYARALVELEASGKTPLELTDARHKRALLLRKTGNASEALLEFERYARAYQTDAFVAGYREVERSSVELAAWGYISVGAIILHDLGYSEPALQQKLSLVARHLLDLLKYIARRYTTQVEGLLTATEIHLALGDKSEAQALFERADDLYHRQRLGSPAGTDGISRHLERLRVTLGKTKRKPRSTSGRNPRKNRTAGKRGTRR